MKAIILTAGLGTRLRPLTTLLPKPLMPIVNRPLIDLLVDNLKCHGFTQFGINLHHLPDMIREYLKGRGEEYHFSFEPVILDTGGGIAKFSEFLSGEEFFLVHNGDIVSNIDISGALDWHREHKALATLVLVDNAPTNVVKVVPSGRIIDLRDSLGADDERARKLTFSGIAVYDTDIFSRLPHTSIFSIIDYLLGEIQKGERPVMGYIPDTIPYWRDVGSISTYMALHGDILEKKIFAPRGVSVPADGRVIADNVIIGDDVVLDGFVVAGNGARFERNLRLKDVIVFPETVIRSGARACHTIFADSLVIEVEKNAAG